MLVFDANKFYLVAQFAFKGFALELAQGNFPLFRYFVVQRSKLTQAPGCIPCMVPFGLVEFFLSTLDYGNLWKTCYFTGRHMVTNALRGKL